MISGSPAVRRITKKLELAQIWVRDPKISPLDEEQLERMVKQFRRDAIPLHVMVDPHTGQELIRFKYSPLVDADDYVEFLEKGIALYDAAHAK